MSEQENQTSPEPAAEAQPTTAPNANPSTPDAATEASSKLSGLMADGRAGTSPQTRPNLDAAALLAAQQAIAEGERALAVARAQLANEPPEVVSGSKRRELVLRLLLAANVLAMIVVAMLPGSGKKPDATTNSTSAQPQQPSDPVPVGPRLATKYNQALLASDSGEYAKAIALLTDYLAESPRMAPSRKVNVYRQMAHYAAQMNLFTQAQDYERRADALTRSHSLPEDLVAMAHAALANNDHEGLRQVWARFLLQQRQIPSSLYQHVAEAYLQLGDSYRVQANDAAEKTRLEELEKTEAMLREQARSRGKD